MVEGEDKVLVTGEQMQLKVLSAFAMDRVINLDDLNDVVISNLADGHVLTWDNTSGRWKNEAIPA